MAFPRPSPPSPSSVTKTDGVPARHQELAPSRMPFPPARGCVTKPNGVPARWRSPRQTGPNSATRRPDRRNANAYGTRNPFCQRGTHSKDADGTLFAFCRRFMNGNIADETRFPFCQPFVPPCADPNHKLPRRVRTGASIKSTPAAMGRKTEAS